MNHHVTWCDCTNNERYRISVDSHPKLYVCVTQNLIPEINRCAAVPNYEFITSRKSDGVEETLAACY